MFAVLFDPTEFNLGAELITNISPIASGIAEVIGNVLWIFGSINLLVVIILGLLLFNEDALKAAFKTFDKRTSEYYIIKLTFLRKSWVILVSCFHLFAIGSGFWFTGTTSLILLCLIVCFRAKCRELFAKT